MNNKSGFRYRLAVFATLLLILAGCFNPPDEAPVARTSADPYDGSVYWALVIALESTIDFYEDRNPAEFYLQDVNNDFVMDDGRLPANYGFWKFVYFYGRNGDGINSFYAKVYHDGTLETGTYNDPNFSIADGPVESFVNSPDIMNSIKQSGFYNANQWQLGNMWYGQDTDRVQFLSREDIYNDGSNTRHLLSLEGEYQEFIFTGESDQ